MPDLDIFGLEFGNNLAIFEISTLKFLILQNFTKKQKSLNLRPKIPYLDIFDKKCLIWVLLGMNCCKKTIAIFEIRTLKLVYLHNFMEKQNCLNLGPKMNDVGIFGLEFKTTLLYLKSGPLGLSICKIWREN